MNRIATLSPVSPIERYVSFLNVKRIPPRARVSGLNSYVEGALEALSWVKTLLEEETDVLTEVEEMVQVILDVKSVKFKDRIAGMPKPRAQGAARNNLATME